MVRKVFLFAVLSLALSGAAFADSGNLSNFNGGDLPQPQSQLQLPGGIGSGGFFSSYGSRGENTLFFSELFDGNYIQFVVNTNRGYFNGFTFVFGNAVVPTPDASSLPLLMISLVGLAFAFRKKLKLQQHSI